MVETQTAGIDKWADSWPEYECRTVNNFAPISCSECDSLTQRFYYMEVLTDAVTSYEWRGMCIGCENKRNETLQGLYE